ncbi:MAG: 30S ribosomal protein S17 [Candidatus Aenigmarchaeota archaeon]|nr:30S ribosomal protein S17 [Candidatus Aenigmarchaeota archaeon]MCK5321840.1 30S ribosomal protein S17 [Candidatus Aenigmarchaeota archaeon]
MSEKKSIKNIGIEIKTYPKEDCSDKNCPFHGSLKIRGKIFQGTVKSTKVQNAAIIEWDYTRYNKKYERYKRLKTRVTAHKPACLNIHENDIVRIGECKPISKTKKFVIFEKLS